MPQRDSENALTCMNTDEDTTKPMAVSEYNLAHDVTNLQSRTADVLFTSDDQHLMNNVQFKDLQLSEPILAGLRDAGFIRPSPVQLKAIPLGRLGVDLIIQAKSGTGKTVVFAIVVLEAVDTRRTGIQALIISPTREIALQSQTVIKQLGSHLNNLRCHLFVGGLPLADDLRRLAECHIAVCTPGRLRYLLESGYLLTDYIKHFVLDEADLLLMGGVDAKLTGGSANSAFPEDINYIWWNLPPNKQVLALSATYNDYLVEHHLPRYMNNPMLVKMTVDDPILLGVRQFFHVIKPASKAPASVFSAKISFLCKLLNSVDFQQCLIFSNFHSCAHDLCDALHSRGWPVTYISSGLDQNERFKAFNKLKAFQCRIVISTDLTSRGIDAENVNLVISLEVPWDYETYLHRVGRAGRFGTYGASLLIISDVGDECELLRQLEVRCPSKIRQLPDPIPTDLATSSCSIELNNLVTVTASLNNNMQGRQAVKSESKVDQAVNNYLECGTSKEFTDQPYPIPDRNQTQLKNLSNGIAAYAEFANSVNCFITTKNENSESNQIEISNNLKKLRDLDKVLSDSYQNYRTIYECSQINTLPTVPSSSKSDAVTSCPKPRTTTTTGTDAYEPPFTKQLTSKQIAAWYEYHSLIPYAKYFHSEWLSALNEYNRALNYLHAIPDT